MSKKKKSYENDSFWWISCFKRFWKIFCTSFIFFDGKPWFSLISQWLNKGGQKKISLIIKTKFSKYLNKRFPWDFGSKILQHIETWFFLQKCGTEVYLKDLDRFIRQKLNFLFALQPPHPKDESTALYFTSTMAKILERGNYYFILFIRNCYANFVGKNGHKGSNTMSCPNQTKH